MDCEKCEPIPCKGWLLRIDEGYYVYRVDQYALWAGLTPREYREEIGLKEPELKTLRVEGEYLIGSRDDVAGSWRRYRSDLLRREKGERVRIKSGRMFSLILKLVKDGIIPYLPNVVKTRRLGVAAFSSDRTRLKP